MQYIHGFISCVSSCSIRLKPQHVTISQMNNTGHKNALRMCRYLSPLTVYVRPSASSKKYGPIMRSHIIAHRTVTRCGCNDFKFKFFNFPLSNMHLLRAARRTVPGITWSWSSAEGQSIVDMNVILKNII